MGIESQAARIAFRAQYLQQMGVSQWYARKRLPGAAVSSSAIYQAGVPLPANDSSPSELTVARVEAPVSVSASAPAPNVGSDAAKVALASLNTPEDSAANAPLSLDDQQGRPQLSDSARQFSVSVRAYIFESILITSEIERDRADAPERRLANNIVNACLGEAVTILSASEFEWPVFVRNELHDKLAIDGREVCGTWFASLLKSQPSFHIHFGSSDEVLAQASQDESIRSFHFTFSLSELLTSPASKALCWKTLLEQGAVRSMSAQGA